MRRESAELASHASERKGTADRRVRRSGNTAAAAGQEGQEGRSGLGKRSRTWDGPARTACSVDCRTWAAYALLELQYRLRGTGGGMTEARRGGDGGGGGGGEQEDWCPRDVAAGGEENPAV